MKRHYKKLTSPSYKNIAFYHKYVNIFITLPVLKFPCFTFFFALFFLVAKKATKSNVTREGSKTEKCIVGGG